MKKILLMIAIVAMLGAIASCSDDEPKRGNGVFTVNTPMINHIVNTADGQVVGIASTHNKLTFDTVNHKGSLELNYNDGSNKTIKLDDLTGWAKRPGFYELSSPSYSQFSGYVDLNQSSIRYVYTTNDGYRIISTISEIFFLKSENTVVYNDSTPNSSAVNVMYQFDIAPANMTATVTVMDIVHVKDLKHFKNIIANNVPITVTANGYAIQAQNLRTDAVYFSTLDSLGHNEKHTDKYPFKTFNATIDLVNDHLDANYMIGNDATVTASGTTYTNN